MYSSLQGCQTATETHMPHRITQCYLPPGRGDIPALTPAKAGTRLSDPGHQSVDLFTISAVLANGALQTSTYINIEINEHLPQHAIANGLYWKAKRSEKELKTTEEKRKRVEDSEKESKQVTLVCKEITVKKCKITVAFWDKMAKSRWLFGLLLGLRVRNFF